MFVDASAKRSKQEHIDLCVAEGRCLNCEAKAAAGRRQLCMYHFSEFHDEKNSRPEKERPAFEAKQIREGKILASQPGRKRRTKTFT